MDIELRKFMAHFLGVAGATLAFVILVSFLSIPMSLGGHPGEMKPHDGPVTFHPS